MELYGLAWSSKRSKTRLFMLEVQNPLFGNIKNLGLQPLKPGSAQKTFFFAPKQSPRHILFFWFVHPALHESTATKTEEAQFVGVFCMRIKRKICCGKWFMSNSVCDQHAIFCRWSPITFDFKEETAYREQDLSLATMSLHC